MMELLVGHYPVACSVCNDFSGMYLDWYTDETPLWDYYEDAMERLQRFGDDGDA